ncbi:ATP-dependent DNA helicase [candidate division WOR-3 bacterium]|nr:ATP-dependent DNA helicase [candidate division WOR-3 bacterium]
MNTPDNKNGTPVLRIGVRTLVEFILRSGDLDLTTFGAIHPSEGTRIHCAIQGSRPPEYDPEVPVQSTQATPLYLLVVSGRIDGVYTYPDRVVIEEIKTTKKDLASFDAGQDPLHWAQAQCYAYMYAAEHALQSIDVRLTYHHVETGTEKEYTRTFTAQFLQDYFAQLIQRYMVWADRRMQWLITRNGSIRATVFPFDAFRPGQKQLMGDVKEIIAERGQLFLQAPTGSGKTMAVLYAVVQALPEHDLPVFFYLTARTTGRVAAEATFAILRDHGLRCKVLSLTAKEKVCFNKDRMCNGSDCAFARGFYDRLPAALEDALTHDGLTRETVIMLARKHRVCPFEFSLEISLWVDCVICDYNYAFDPKVYLKRFFAEEEGNYVFLVDEAHNLVDRSRDMFSAEINKHDLGQVAEAVGKNIPSVSRALDAILQMMTRMEEECAIAGNPHAEHEPPEELYPLLIDFTSAGEQWLNRNEFTVYREILLDTYFEVKRFLWTAEQYNDTYATCYTMTGDDLKIALLCMDPAHHMAQALTRSRSAVFFSATLHPVTFFVESLGCDPEASTLIVPSPFDSENLCVLIAHKISTFFKFREYTKPEIVKAICSMIDQRVGNYLVFFPSYEYMNAVHDNFRRQRGAIPTIMQTSSMSEMEREEFITRFKTNRNEYLVGFAVMGGAFAESIDLLGEQLTGAVIVGVGMPGICLERELIKEYYDGKIGAGYAFAYQYPGMIKVLQAAGRVIRSENDRGVLLFIDTRYARPEYLELLPKDWRIRYVAGYDAIADLVQRFWRHERTA